MSGPTGASQMREIGERVTDYHSQEIHQKIMAIGFENCKVFIHSVDAQSSADGGIILQVIGEMTNRGEAWRKFVQTFFLAPQPNGYFVLNDIFRFLKEESVEDEEVEEGSGPSRALRTVRHLGLKRLTDFVRGPVTYDFSPYMPEAFRAFISPRLPMLDQENTRSPSALLDLFHAWMTDRHPVRARTLPLPVDAGEHAPRALLTTAVQAAQDRFGER